MNLERLTVSPGVVYILRNSAHRGTIVKIGRTVRTSETRASELSSATGVPTPFEVLYEEAVANCELAERLIHQRLVAYRVNEKREFFDVPLKVAVGAVFETCLKVNSQTLRENSRLAIVVKPGASGFQGVANLLQPFVGGNTAVRIILRSANASGELDLGDRFLVHCTPELLALLHRESWVEEIGLYSPAET